MIGCEIAIELPARMQTQMHLKLLVEHLLLKELGYSLDSTLSSSNWYALRKGNSGDR